MRTTIYVPTPVSEELPTENGRYHVQLARGETATLRFTKKGDLVIWEVGIGGETFLDVISWLKPVQLQEELTDEEMKKKGEAFRLEQYPDTFKMESSAGYKGASFALHFGYMQGFRDTRSFYQPRIATIKEVGELYEDCLSILALLVNLKEIKDNPDKTTEEEAYYKEYKPKTWQQAKDFLDGKSPRIELAKQEAIKFAEFCQNGRVCTAPDNRWFDVNKNKYYTTAELFAKFKGEAKSPA